MYLSGRYHEYAARRDLILTEIDKMDTTAFPEPYYLIKPVKMHRISFQTRLFIKEIMHIEDFKANP